MPYSPQITSYDYDAPIDEAGNATPKYMAFREVIQKHLPPGVVLPPVPPAKRTIAIPRFTLQESAGLFSNLPTPTVADRPLSFEDLHQGYGYVLYRTRLKGPLKGTLQIDRLRDYALVVVNGKRVAVLDRRLNQDSVGVDIPAGDVTLDLFVENLGRINYGPFLNDNRKGITERVTLNGQELKGWSMYGFPFNDVSGVTFAKAGRHSGPVIRRGTFSLEDTADTYLDMRDWGKGSVWLNGHSIGRYWYVGPQQTLYVPGPWLRKGRNEVVVLELLQEDQDQLQSIQTPILDELAVPTVSIRGRYDVARQACILQMAYQEPGRRHLLHNGRERSDGDVIAIRRGALVQQADHRCCAGVQEGHRVRHCCACGGLSVIVERQARRADSPIQRSLSRRRPQRARGRPQREPGFQGRVLAGVRRERSGSDH